MTHQYFSFLSSPLLSSHLTSHLLTSLLLFSPNSHATRYTRVLALKRLHKLCLPFNRAQHTLSLMTRHFNKGTALQITLDHAVQSLQKYITVKNIEKFHSKIPIFEISLKGLQFHHYRLTYDHKSTIHVRDLLITDHARYPVFHIEFSKKIEEEKKKQNEREMNRAESSDKVNMHSEKKQSKEKIPPNNLGPRSTEDRIAQSQSPKGLLSSVKNSTPPNHAKPLCAADIEERARLSEEKEAQCSGCALIVSYVLQVRTNIILTAFAMFLLDCLALPSALHAPLLRA